MKKNKEIKLFEGNVNIVEDNKDIRNEVIVDILKLLENYKEKYDIRFNRNENKMLDVTIRNYDGSIYKRLIEEKYNMLKIERYFEGDYYPETYYWDLINDRELILEQI